MRLIPRHALLAWTILALSGLPAYSQGSDGTDLDLPSGADAPVPAERPDEPDEAPADNPAERDTDEDDREDDDADEPSPPQDEDAAALRACRAALAGLGVEFKRLDPILPENDDQSGCGVANPFTVSRIAPDIALAPATEMRCETALALARWVDREVVPAARALDLGPLSSLTHGSTYVCRPRNNVADAKISEHAKGNAIDIMHFTFEDGTAISVSPKEGDGDREEAFQKAVGSGACLYFTTVLGPGSDAYHDDHLHLDIAERNGGFRLCQTP